MSADYVAQLVPGATVQSSSEWDEYGEQQCVEIALGPSGDLRLFLFSAGQDKPALTVRQLTAEQQQAEAAQIAAGQAEWDTFISCPLLKQRDCSWRQWWNGLTRQQQQQHMRHAA